MAVIKQSELDFDIRSSKKLSHLLFDVLGVRPVEFSEKTKKPSTSEGCIVKMLETHPMVKELNELWKDCGGSAPLFLYKALEQHTTGNERKQVETYFILKSVLELRGTEKERNTYVSQLEEYTVDGFLHPGFSMHTTVTGRLSSSNPAIQNFPKKTLLRKCFRSRFGEDGILLQADGSQMELRVLAEISGDTNLRLAYCGNPETGEGPKDIHRMTASEIFHLPEWDIKVADSEVHGILLQHGLRWEDALIRYREWLDLGGNVRGKQIPMVPHTFSSKYLLLPDGYEEDKFKKEDFKNPKLHLRGIGSAERSPSKTVVFGIVYGMGPQGLAGQLGLSPHVAEDYINAYFRKFPGVKSFIDRIKEKTMQTQQVVSMFGRIRRLPEVASEERGIREEALRQAVNFLVQSSASDLTLFSYFEFNTWLRQQGLKSKPWALIHDAIDVDVHLDEFDLVSRKVKECMEHNRFGWTVPLVADVEIGEDWKSMEKITKLLEVR